MDSDIDWTKFDIEQYRRDLLIGYVLLITKLVLLTLTGIAIVKEWTLMWPVLVVNGIVSVPTFYYLLVVWQRPLTTYCTIDPKAGQVRARRGEIEPF